MSPARDRANSGKTGDNGDAASTWFCDFNAGAPALPDVVAEFVAVEQRCPGNPASAHAAGRRARAELERARERIASTFGLHAGDVLFTSGGTESANLAVAGLGDPARPVLLAPVEHPAVFEPAAVRGTSEWLVDETGAAIVTAPDRPVGMICLVHAQSELGTLQRVDEAARLARQLGVPCFVDAAQTLGRVALQPVVDSGAVLALSPHKAGGLRGLGVLLGEGLTAQLRPLLRGGGQEFGARPGTQSPALAAANALAIEQAVREQPQRAIAMAAARDGFLAGLGDEREPHRVLTPLANSLANTLMLCFEHVDGRNLLPALDLAGVQASFGSACSSGAPTPPRILAAIGLDACRARACVRFSFGWLDDRDRLVDVGARVGAVVQRLGKKN